MQIKRKKVTLDAILTQNFWSVAAFIRFTAEDKVSHVGSYLLSNRKYLTIPDNIIIKNEQFRS